MIDYATLIVNARGLAAAAFLPVDRIAAAVGCSRDEAMALQQTAQSDFLRLQDEIRRAKSRP